MAEDAWTREGVFFYMLLQFYCFFCFLVRREKYASYFGRRRCVCEVCGEEEEEEEVLFVVRLFLFHTSIWKPLLD